MPAELDFRFTQAPPPGEALEVAEGVLWLRLPLPFRLDHVNVYLIEDGTGFALLDTGIDDAPTRERLVTQAIDVAGSTPEQFKGYIESETDKWAKVIKFAGVKPEE